MGIVGSRLLHSPKEERGYTYTKPHFYQVSDGGLRLYGASFNLRGVAFKGPHQSSRKKVEGNSSDIFSHRESLTRLEVV